MRGYVYIVLAACLWAFLGPFAKIAFREGVSPMEVAFWRAVLAWGFFGTHALVRGQVRMAWRDVPALVTFGVTGVALFYGVYQMAVKQGGAALAAVLLYTAPAWVTVMSRILYKEAVTPAKLTALFLTLAGVAGISLGSGGGAGFRVDAAAVLLGLSAGLCYSMYYVFGKHFSGRYTSPNLFVYMLPIGAACLYPWVQFSPKSPAAWAALGVIAAFCTYGAYYCYYLGIKHLEISRASIVATLEPVVAALVAYVWWDEIFMPLGYAGSAMILSAVLLVVWDESRKWFGRSPGKMP
jgi:DME family drug/metabolite transporter